MTAHGTATRLARRYGTRKAIRTATIRRDLYLKSRYPGKERGLVVLRRLKFWNEVTSFLTAH